jgi:hypothetical protein
MLDFVTLFSASARPTRDAAESWIGRWTPGIGDPSIGGWETAGAYGLAAALRVRVLLKSRASLERFELRIWRALIVALVALGINKQLDLQTAFTEIGRIVARAGGWYAHRQVVQGAFIVSVALTSLALGSWLWRLTRTTSSSTRLAIAGFLGTLLFVVIRAASFHHVDRLIGHRVFTLRGNWLLECGPLLVTCLGAYRRARVDVPPVAMGSSGRD